MSFLTIKNIIQAYKLARKSRKDKKEVYDFDLKKEVKLKAMLSWLQQRTYKHGIYDIQE